MVRLVVVIVIVATSTVPQLSCICKCQPSDMLKFYLSFIYLLFKKTPLDNDAKDV